MTLKLKKMIKAKKYSSEIKCISVICMLLVLYIHSCYSSNEFPNYNILYWIQQVMASYLGRLAVPTFFMLSGFLFYNNILEKGLSYKLKTRFFTLVVPYLFGCSFFVAIMYILSLLCPSTLNTAYLYIDLFNKNIIDILKETYIISTSDKPLAFHLWFLRNLIVVVLTTSFIPIIPIKIRQLCLVLLLIIASFSDSTSIATSSFWFYLGGFISTRCKHLNISKKMAYVSAIFFIGLSFFEAFVHKLLIWQYLQIPIIFLGIVAFIYMCINFNVTFRNSLLHIAPYTFFIYLSHEPFINIIRKLLPFILGNNQMMVVLAYITTPILSILLLICVAKTFKRFFPLAYSIYVGNR